MGEADLSRFSFCFNGSVRFEPRDMKLSENGGAVLLREIDERFCFTPDLAANLHDPRNPEKITHPLEELLRSRVYAMVQGFNDQDDLDFLRNDPVFRIVVSERRGLSPLDPVEEDERIPDGLGSQPTQSRLVKALSIPENLEALNDHLFVMAEREWAEILGKGPVILDIDSFPIDAYGTQPGSGYSGHYGRSCFHPLITMLSRTAAVLRADLRPGNAWTATGAVKHVRAVLDRAEESFGTVHALRGDAGFPTEDFCSLLEERGVFYALRLKTNQVLERLAKPNLRRPPGSPPTEPRVWFHELRYKAEPWDWERRVVLVVKEVPGELFLDHFFLLTNFDENEAAGECVLEFYRDRATMERHIGEFKSILSPALSSAPRRKTHYRRSAPEKQTASIDAARVNCATFLLYLIAYNLMNVLRNLAAQAQPPSEPVPSLDRIRQTMLKVAARLTRSARYATFVVNEICRKLWSGVMHRLRGIDFVVQTE